MSLVKIKNDDQYKERWIDHSENTRKMENCYWPKCLDWRNVYTV